MASQNPVKTFVTTLSRGNSQVANRAKSDLTIKLIVSVSIAIASFIISSLIGSQNTIARVELTIAIAAWVYIGADAVTNKNGGYVTILATLYFTLSMLIPGMFHLAINTFPFFNVGYSVETCMIACLMVMLFSLTCLLGYKWRGFNFINMKDPRRFYLNKTAALTLGLVFMALSFAVAAYTGFTRFTVLRRDLTQEFASPLIVFMTNFSRYSSFIAFLVTLKITIGKRINVIALGVTVVAFCLFIFLNNPLTIPRSTVFSYLMSGLVSFNLFSKTRNKLFVAIMYPTAMLTIFPFLSFVARGTLGANYDFNLSEYYTTSGDFDGLQSTINVFEWVRDSGVKWGHQLLSAILAPLPRAIWVNKALPTGLAAAAYEGYPFTNISSPLPSEFYADFGWVGVIAGAFATGVFIKNVDMAARRAAITGRFSDLVICAVITGGIIAISRGALLGVIAPIALAVALAFCVRIIDLPAQKAR